jgi:hypothetical protein
MNKTWNKKLETLAIEKSIEHWQENLSLLQLNYLSDEKDLTLDISYMGDSCPLCNGFSMCCDCPIFKKTGTYFCTLTPWTEIRGLIQYCRSEYSRKDYYKKLFKAFSKEINFLESLLYV